MGEEKAQNQYRGRLAPTPSGYLHEGNMKTFHTAMDRAHQANGIIALRLDDLDPSRCKQKFIDACYRDLRKEGLLWDEGPLIGGEYGPYEQSYRGNLYMDALLKLKEKGIIYPCELSRSEIKSAGIKSRLGDEYLFPKELSTQKRKREGGEFPGNTNWRFATNWGDEVEIIDGRLGEVSFKVGSDFADFLVWRKDGLAAYELATVVDDHLMKITEIVRGEDLLVSSARQCVLFDALKFSRPNFYHCPIIYDKDGRKLSKSIRTIM